MGAAALVTAPSTVARGSAHRPAVPTPAVAPSVQAKLATLDPDLSDFQAQPTMSSPSGPPTDAAAGWRFTLSANDPVHGRLYVFPDAQRAQALGHWFDRSQTSYLIHGNVIVWVDPRATATDLSSLTHAVQQL